MPHRSLPSFTLSGVILIVLGASGVVTARSFQQPVPSDPTPAIGRAAESKPEPSENFEIQARQFGVAKSARRERQGRVAGSNEIQLIADQPPRLDQSGAATIADAVQPPAPNVSVEPLNIQPLHRVQLAEDGLLPGRLSLIDPAAGDRIAVEEIVVHFVRNGTIVSVVEPGVGGVFQARGLTPGIYSVIAAGPSGLLASAVEIAPPLRRDAVIEAQQGQGAARLALATALEIRGNPIPARHLAHALPLIRTRLSIDEFSSAADRRSQSGTERAPATEAFEEDGAKIGTEGPPVVQTGTADALHAVHLRTNGQIGGTVRRLDAANGRPIHFADTDVYIIQDDGVTGRTQTDEQGRFLLQGARPGVASFVAIGRAGFAAFSFEVRPPEDPSAHNLNQGTDRNFTQVAFIQNEGLEIASASQVDAALVDPADFALAQNIIDEFSPDDVLLAPPPPVPFPTGPVGFGGGGFGGGGGGGVGGGGLFGGNLGGLLLGAGVGAGVGAAIGSNRSRSERVIIVSPAVVD